MSKNFLAFLGGASVEEVKGAAPRKGGGGRAKQWNPAATLLAIRVWKDGSVFPSQAAVDQFNLEYPKVIITRVPVKKIDESLQATIDKAPEGAVEVEVKMKNAYEYPNGTGNGFDVIDSRDWAGYKAEGNMLFIAAVPKNEGKVDLFQSTNYELDGTPKTSVMEQGSMTFGRDTLIPAIEELYGVIFHKPGREAVEADPENGIEAEPAFIEVEGVEFIDMVIVAEAGGVNIVEKFSTPFTHVPKKVNRGEDKGKSDYVRREGLKIHGFVPATLLGITSTTDAVTERSESAELSEQQEELAEQQA